MILLQAAIGYAFFFYDVSIIWSYIGRADHRLLFKN